MQSRVALGAGSRKIDTGIQGGRAVIATRRCNSLYHARQTRTRHIDGRPRTLLARTLVPALKSVVGVFAAGVLIAVLFVLTIAVHIVVDGHSLLACAMYVCVRLHSELRRGLTGGFGNRVRVKTFLHALVWASETRPMVMGGVSEIFKQTRFQKKSHSNAVGTRRVAVEVGFPGVTSKSLFTTNALVNPEKSTLGQPSDLQVPPFRRESRSRRYRPAHFSKALLGRFKGLSK
jgi:hypothetical protein